MSVLTVQAWHCDLCGQTWLSEAKPKRCSKCKSSKWNGSGPIDYPGKYKTPHAEPLVERAVDAGLRAGHETKTCRIYGCLMCKALKA